MRKVTNNTRTSTIERQKIQLAQMFKLNKSKLDVIINSQSSKV